MSGIHWRGKMHSRALAVASLYVSGNPDRHLLLLDILFYPRR